jgi:2-keto-4-pentenoate hydratase/2-oxohepta-3-ene-1,7-dioic acid hydratase in catechol pathway
MTPDHTVPSTTFKGDRRAPVRFARFEAGGVAGHGLVHGDSVTKVDCTWAEGLELLADGDSESLARKQLAPPLPLAHVTLLAPVDAGSDIHCVGLNYVEHQREAGELVDGPADAPIIFAKTLRAVASPGAELALPTALSAEFDWEAELGVVIGRDGSNIEPERCWEHVAGYCVVNDITARDLQVQHKQWHLGKNAAGSSPVGPWVLERDALAVPPDVEVSLAINGVTKQRARTSQLIYDIPSLVTLLSSIMTLRVGDIIATGTPSGVGFKRLPPEYLTDGDVVTTSIEGVGSLVNVVRTAAGVDSGRSSASAVPA